MQCFHKFLLRFFLIFANTTRFRICLGQLPQTDLHLYHATVPNGSLFIFELSRSLKDFSIYEIFFRTSSFNYLLINKLINSAILVSNLIWFDYDPKLRKKNKNGEPKHCINGGVFASNIIFFVKPTSIGGG